MRRRIAKPGAALAALLLCGMLGMALPAVAKTATTTRSFIGKAYALDGGKLLYTEHHDQTLVNGKLQSATVTYDLPDGKLLAKKTLNFSKSPYAPDFQTVNHVTGEMEAGQLEGSRYHIRYRKNRNAKVQTATIKPSPDLIADAGFDGYVVAHLKQLRAGKTVTFRFLVPNRLTTYTFRASRSGSETLFGRKAIVITVDLDNFFLRLLAPSFKMAYDVHTGELLSYDGLSNLGDANGKYQVHIVYPNGQLDHAVN